MSQQPGWKAWAIGIGIAVALPLLIVGALFAERAKEEGAVSATTLGAVWPLTVPHGHVRCDALAAIFTDPSGREWALNGIALGRGYPRIDPIWRDSQLHDGKINIGPLIDAALARC